MHSFACLCIWGNAGHHEPAADHRGAVMQTSRQVAFLLLLQENSIVKNSLREGNSFNSCLHARAAQMKSVGGYLFSIVSVISRGRGCPNPGPNLRAWISTTVQRAAAAIHRHDPLAGVDCMICAYAWSLRNVHDPFQQSTLQDQLDQPASRERPIHSA